MIHGIKKICHLAHIWFHLRDSVQLVLCHGESFQHFERSDVFRQHLDLVPGQVKISQVPNNLKLTWLDFLLEFVVSDLITFVSSGGNFSNFWSEKERAPGVLINGR